MTNNSDARERAREVLAEAIAGVDSGAQADLEWRDWLLAKPERLDRVKLDGRTALRAFLAFAAAPRSEAPKRGDKIKWVRALDRRPLAVKDAEFVTVASWGLPNAPLAVTLQEVVGAFPMGWFDVPTPQPASASDRREAIARQFERIKSVETAMANGAHYADDPECHPCYPTLVAARQILEAEFAALTPDAGQATHVAEHLTIANAVQGAFKFGDRVEKIKGSSWRGIVVGTYSTTLTPEGYAIESENEPGSVQIYPASALRLARTPAARDGGER